MSRQQEIIEKFTFINASYCENTPDQREIAMARKREIVAAAKKQLAPRLKGLLRKAVRKWNT